MRSVGAATPAPSATTPGDRVITPSFSLDTGQRDSYYDIGRIHRKASYQTPTGRLLIVYDYFTAGTGDYFSVDSYTGQVTYDDIPQYLATKVDPESIAPVGQYELRDSLDFRPGIQAQTAAAYGGYNHMKIRGGDRKVKGFGLCAQEILSLIHI